MKCYNPEHITHEGNCVTCYLLNQDCIIRIEGNNQFCDTHGIYPILWGPCGFIYCFKGFELAIDRIRKEIKNETITLR